MSNDWKSIKRYEMRLNNMLVDEFFDVGVLISWDIFLCPTLTNLFWL